jgi:tRNA (guanosine-2'-O-)-methyltransferase
MERVNKPHNFSAILRNCDAVGVLRAHVVPPEKEIDLHHHTSGGTTRWVQVQVHGTVEAAGETLKASGFKILAAHPSEGAVDFREVDLTRPVAFMVGAELDGLSESGLSVADEAVQIPMVGMVHSLNVSVATALLLYEALRQRQAAGLYGRSRLPEREYHRILFEAAYPEIAKVLQSRNEPYPRLSPNGEFLGGTDQS